MAMPRRCQAHVNNKTAIRLPPSSLFAGYARGGARARRNCKRMQHTGARVTGHGAHGAVGSDRRNRPPTNTCQIHAAYELPGHCLRWQQCIQHRSRSLWGHVRLWLAEGLLPLCVNSEERPARGCPSIGRRCLGWTWIAKESRSPCHALRQPTGAGLKFVLCYMRTQINSSSQRVKCARTLCCRKGARQPSPVRRS